MRLSSLCLAIAAVFSLATPAAAQPRRPVVERLSPTSGPPGTVVQVVGRNIRPHHRLLMGGVELEIVSRHPSRWTVRVPNGARSGALEIHTRRGVFTGPYFSVTQGRPTPRVDRLEPATGVPGMEVRIYGENFSTRLVDNRVTLGGRPVVLRSATPTTLIVTVPRGATTGPFLVNVHQSGQVQSPTFTIGAGTRVASFSPNAGPPGTQVLINGSGFSPNLSDNRVFLQNRSVRVLSATPNQLTVQIPRGARSAPFMVDVRNGGRTTTPQTFVVQEAPRVRSLRPASGVPGQTVSIVGNNFGADPRLVRVTLGGRVARVRRVVPNEIEVEVPAGAVTGRFEVAINQLSAVSRSDFVVLSPLSIRSFTPLNGGVDTIVTITGSGFSPNPRANVVTLSNARAQVVAASPEQIQVRVPSAPSGPFLVHVQGVGQARSARPFVVTQPPFIASFAPQTATPGSEVVINGSNFGSNRRLVSVDLAGRPMRVRQVSNTRIVAVVPRGARSGVITVRVRLQGIARSSTPLQIGQAFGLSSVTPQQGFVGTTVTIHGSGFVPGTTVQFRGASAVAPRRITPRSLTVVVPAGAQTGAITIYMPGNQTATFPRAFAVSATPGGVGINAIMPTCNRPGCQVTLVGYGFSSTPTHNRTYFGGRPARVVRATPTELVVVIPRNAGSHAFRVDVLRSGEAQSAPFNVVP